LAEPIAVDDAFADSGETVSSVRATDEAFDVRRTVTRGL